MAHALHLAVRHPFDDAAAHGLVHPPGTLFAGQVNTLYVGSGRQGLADHLAPLRHEEAVLAAGRLVRKRPDLSYACFGEHGQPRTVKTILMNCTTP